MLNHETGTIMNLSQTMYVPPQFPVSSSNSISISAVLPQLQTLLKQNTIQRDQIAAVMKCISQGETPSAYRSSNLASKTSCIGAENFMFDACSDRERELLQEIVELENRVANLGNELQREKTKNAQLERQLNAIFNKEEEERIRREEVARDIG